MGTALRRSQGGAVVDRGRRRQRRASAAGGRVAGGWVGWRGAACGTTQWGRPPPSWLTAAAFSLEPSPPHSRPPLTTAATRVAADGSHRVGMADVAARAMWSTWAGGRAAGGRGWRRAAKRRVVAPQLLVDDSRPTDESRASPPPLWVPTPPNCQHAPHLNSLFPPPCPPSRPPGSSTPPCRRSDRRWLVFQ